MIRFAFWLLLTTVLATGAFAHVESLPDGDGKAIIETQCGSCHTADRVTQYHLDRDRWDALIRQMMEFGASLKEPEVKTAVDYLAKNFGPQAPSAEAQTEIERTAKKHIEGICSTCHTASLIRETEATREEWLEIVKKMNSKGSGLSDVDVELLTDYLAKNYPKKP